MANTTTLRRPPVVVLPVNPSVAGPATFIFLHGYNDVASTFNSKPASHLSVAHHIHKSPLLQHVKIIIPEALPCIFPTITGNVWYNMPYPVPIAGDPLTAKEHVEFGHASNDQADMNESLDYFEELIRAEIENGTPARRIVLMGYSQGASVAVLFIQTRRLAADLAGVISLSGFHATDLQSVFAMQREHGLMGRWSKETRLLLLQGKGDVFVHLENFQSWRKQLEGFQDRGKGIGSIEWTIADGVRHSIRGTIWPYVNKFLEDVLYREQQHKL